MSKAIDTRWVVEVYRADRKLKDAFVTHSGALVKKVIIQLIFYQNGKPVFVYELPLSPSLKEMPQDIENTLQVYQALAFQKSLHLKRALSYLKGIGNTALVVTKPIHECIFNTFSIGKWPKAHENNIAKLKGDAASLDALIAYTHSTDNLWVADFNGSLNINEFLRLAKKGNLKNCVWLEQPLATGIMTPSLAKEMACPIYADEEMDRLSPEAFWDSGYKGLVIKFLRHDYPQLIDWITFCQQNSIPCLASMPVCDVVAMSICRFFNAYMTVQQKDLGTDTFFHSPHLSEELFLSDGVTINGCWIDFIRTHYTPIGSYVVEE